MVGGAIFLPSVIFLYSKDEDEDDHGLGKNRISSILNRPQQ